MALVEFGKNDCKIMSVNWMGMGIGAGFNISTPELKRSYADDFRHQYIAVCAFFCGLQMDLSILLWKINE